MINEVFYSHDLKCRVKQISKRKARTLWDEGREIYFHSSNMRFDNMWQHPMPASKDGYSFVGYTKVSECIKAYNGCKDAYDKWTSLCDINIYDICDWMQEEYEL